jgi:hypothetical protein
MRNQGGAFLDKAAYIFCRQMEVADAIALNRIDEMSDRTVQSCQSGRPQPTYRYAAAY